MNKILLGIMISLFFMPRSYAQVTFNLSYDSNTEFYTVSMRSGATYTDGMARLSNTTQIMIVAPIIVGGYQITNLTSSPTNGVPINWDYTRIDGPFENANKSYFFFSPTNAGTYTPFDIPANIQIDLFSFQSGSGCVGALNLMDNLADAFVDNGSFNATNNIVLVGGGKQNLYQGNTSGNVFCNSRAITYCIEYDAIDQKYIMSIESAVLFEGHQARLSPSTQVTLVVPHVDGGLQISDLTGLQDGSTPLDWTMSRLDAPTANTVADYLFFSPANAFTYTPFDIIAQAKIPLFSFKLAGACAGDIAFYDKDTDPIRTMVQYSPENNMVVMGGGKQNQYRGNSCSAVSCPAICLAPKVLLQGALLGNLPTDMLMRDDLRRQGLLPLEQPYDETSMGARFVQMGGGNEEANPFMFSNDAFTPDAIVDWVFLEYRDTVNKSVFRTQSALVQRDGDIVSPEDGQCLLLDSLPSAFYLSVKHRNHLGAMSNYPLIVKSDTLTYDFTTQNLGQDSLVMTTMNGKYALWAGNGISDKVVKYMGDNNDQLEVLNKILIDLNNIKKAKNFANTVGYYHGDVNMDGRVKFEGINNDRILIQNIVINHPLNTLRLPNYSNLLEQLP